MSERKYEHVKEYSYVRKARTITRKGPHGEIERVHLPEKTIHVRAHEARHPRVRRTRIAVR